MSKLFFISAWGEKRFTSGLFRLLINIKYCNISSRRKGQPPDTSGVQRDLISPLQSLCTYNVLTACWQRGRNESQRLRVYTTNLEMWFWIKYFTVFLYLYQFINKWNQRNRACRILFNNFIEFYLHGTVGDVAFIVLLLLVAHQSSK